MAKWQRREGWVGSHIEDSYVMINLDDGAYVALNATATEVWSLLEQARDEEDLIDDLVAKFKVERDHCRQSVRGLIDDLNARALIQAVS